uniref:Uncharacterized protein n=1 Tax=Anguilla anguilla TaxID=7936 RepID=A0A0E9VAH2_ANGAN
MHPLNACANTLRRGNDDVTTRYRSVYLTFFYCFGYRERNKLFIEIRLSTTKYI